MVVEKTNYEREKQTLQPKRKKIDRSKRREEYRKKQFKLKQEKDKKIRSLSVLTAGLIAVFGMIILITDCQIYKKQQEITKIKNDIRIMKENNEDLRIKLLEHSSLENIEKVAKEKLGMVFPEKEDMLQIVK